MQDGQPEIDPERVESDRDTVDEGPLRVFVGTEAAQNVALRVLEHSIKKYATCDVVVTALKDLDIPCPRHHENRPRTEFSFYRFAIPELCGFRGRALYMDADMQVLADVAELYRLPFGNHKVLCTYQPEPPEQWRDLSFFRPGRQYSVMLLDCGRLDWRIDEIIAGLDDGSYTYSELMFELCVVKPMDVADLIPPEWNHLERHVEGLTKLVHYTVVPTDPWKNDRNPLCPLWTAAYEEAVSAGGVPIQEVVDGIRERHIKPTLGAALWRAPEEAWQAYGSSLGVLGSPARIRTALKREIESHCRLYRLRQLAPLSSVARGIGRLFRRVHRATT